MKKLIVILTSALVLAHSAVFAAEPGSSIPPLGDDFFKTQRAQTACAQDVFFARAKNTTSPEKNIQRFLELLQVSAGASPMCAQFNNLVVGCGMGVNIPCLSAVVAGAFWSGCIAMGEAIALPKELAKEYVTCLDKAGVQLPEHHPEKK